MEMMQKTVGNPDWISIGTEEDVLSGAYAADQTYGKNIRVRTEIFEEHTDLFLEAPDTAVKWIKLRWQENLYGGGQILGDAWERSYGDMEWRGLNANRILPWYFLSEQVDGIFGCGVATNPSAFCFWQIDTEGLTLFLDVRCGGMGVKLGGRTLHLASVVQRFFSDCSAFEAGQEFCRQLCKNPVFPDAPVYGSNNWYYAYGHTSEQEILADADYLAARTKNCETPAYMVLDDGWEVDHDAESYNGGPWDRGNEKFPDMARVADQISKRGVKPGIWCRPLLNHDPSLPAEWRNPLTGCLDPTNPDALEYIRQDITRICQWGFTLIKYDFVTYDMFGKWGFEMNPLPTKDGWHFYDPSVTGAEAAKLLYQAIWEAALPYRALILGCNVLGHLGTGWMQLNRVGDDTSGLHWERTRYVGVNTLAFRLCQHGTFYDIDADCVGITEHIPWEFNRQWADLLARSGTPLFVSVDPKFLSEDKNRELEEMLLMASRQDHHAVPLDWMSNTCPEYWWDEEEILHYCWYEKEGLQFELDAERYQTYLNCP